MERRSRLWWLGFALMAAVTHAFAPFPRGATLTLPTTSTTQLAFQKHNYERIEKLENVLDRFDTLKSAGFSSTSSRRPLLMRGPGFKRIAFFLFVGFMYKWYRARFINKIPVWDRQPQWNMVVTNREQEKELKAYTCQNCGSTLFIARNRDWFFEGDTGLGGLGCYTCGAKGKDNFVMDRDRILEDVGEDDDYFDYERPLDFVTAAERRALMKQAQGDEDVANQILVDQANAASNSPPPKGAVDAVIEKTVEQTKKDDEAAKTGESGDAVSDAPKDPVDTTGDASGSSEVKPKKKKKKKKKKKAPVDNSRDTNVTTSSSSSPDEGTETVDKPKKEKKALVDDASDTKETISSSSSTDETAQSVETPQKKKKVTSADEISDMNETPSSSLSADEPAKSVEKQEKSKKEKKKAPEPPKPSEASDDDPWDDLEALGI